MNENWVGRDFWNGFSADVDRQTAREKARQNAQRLFDHQMREWEVKHRASDPGVESYGNHTKGAAI